MCARARLRCRKLAPRLLLGFLCAASELTAAEEVQLFAAASLTDALGELTPAFEKASGHRVVVNLGGSNELARQIRAGAPADVFFSADAAQMDRLVALGLVREEDRRNVLSNVLVAIVPAPSHGQSVWIRSAKDLPTVTRLALADPQAVPAGLYARSWLQSVGLWQRVEAQVVPLLDVRAALAAVESLHADAGIVYRTDAAISKRVRVAFEVPPGEAPPIVYPLALLAAARQPAAAALVGHLTGAAAHAVYRRHGFLVLAAE